MEPSMKERSPTTSPQVTVYGSSSMETWYLGITSKRWSPTKTPMIRRSTSNLTIRATLEFRNQHGKSMLMRSFDTLTHMIRCVVTINDDVWERSAFHNICKQLVLLDCECSTECIPEDVQGRSLLLPTSPKNYHTSRNRAFNIHDWNFVNQILSITQMSLYRFLISIVCTKWVGSGVRQMLSLSSTLFSWYSAGVLLTSEFLYEKR